MQHTHDNNYLIKHVLTDLPPLTERLKLMRANKGPGGIMEKRQAMEKSQVRGRSRPSRLSKQTSLGLLGLRLAAYPGSASLRSCVSCRCIHMYTDVSH